MIKFSFISDKTEHLWQDFDKYEQSSSERNIHRRAIGCPGPEPHSNFISGKGGYLNDTIKLCYGPPSKNMMSCRARCGLRGFAWTFSIIETCACDAECELNQDCCYDFKTVCPTTSYPFNTPDCVMSENIFESNLPNKYKPGGFNEVYKKQELLLITKCPADSQMEDIRLRCEEPTLDRLDVSEVIPVSAVIKGQVVDFRNKFCAKCNLNFTTFQPWKSELKCKHTVQLRETLFKLNHTEKLHFLLRNKACNLYFKPRFSLRPCVSNIVSKCNMSLNSSITEFPALVEACDSYMGIISKKRMDGECSDTLFKNSHCAFCNGLILDDLKCQYDHNFLKKTLIMAPDFSLTLQFPTINLFLSHNNKTFSSVECHKNETHMGDFCPEIKCNSNYILYHNICVPLVNGKSQPNPNGFQTLFMEVDLFVLPSRLSPHFEYFLKENFPKLALGHIRLPSDSPFGIEIVSSFLNFKLKLSIDQPQIGVSISDTLDAMKTIAKTKKLFNYGDTIEFNISHISMYNFNQQHQFTCANGQLQRFNDMDIDLFHSKELGVEVVCLKQLSNCYLPENILFVANKTYLQPSADISILLCKGDISGGSPGSIERIRLSALILSCIFCLAFII